MDENQTMCAFLHDAQEEYWEACALFRARHDLTAVAKVCGIRPNMLRNKLNTEQPHVLSLPEMMAISKASNDYVILEVVLRKLELVTAHIPSGSETESFIKRALNNSILAGEISQLALDNAGNRTLPRSTRNSIIGTAQAGISSLMLLINDIESRTGSTHSFFSVGVDLLASGAALPVLS
ncbi:transcriptional regulator [Vibrio genomosp. F10 str. ZF-129]|uniref:Transcriptional regulator n=1 Tax=Vibrio genomosp. F10 str. ZF-129 TaxID=1187848 RepID=A0A1E5BA42_9VIBR|nr:phage regulatory CII family protein [Vibrio genomosp. F10]OEE30754.1 transcriptional regulator [Vibrio genomosp. F10 str. ZF-129]